MEARTAGRERMTVERKEEASGVGEEKKKTLMNSSLCMQEDKGRKGGTYLPRIKSLLSSFHPASAQK